MLRAAIANQPDRFVLFPTQWEEVTLKQFFALDTTSLMLALASDPALLLQLPDAAADTAVLPFLQFTQHIPDFEQLPLPDGLSIIIDQLERRVTRPREVGLETYGQKLTVQEELRRLRDADKLNYLDAALPLLLVYLYPQLAGKPFVDIADTKPYEAAILALPCTVALPLSAFFLRRFSSSTRSGQVTYELLPMEPTTTYPWWKRPARWFRNWRSIRRMSRRTSSPSTGA